MATVKDGYIFWCSKCKVDHAGECETDSVAKFQKTIDNAITLHFSGFYPGYNAVIKIDDDDGK